MTEKIGLFGGSFDPIHTAHLIIASLIKEEFCLDKIIFIPNFVSPFKQSSCSSEIQHRIEMIKLSISDNQTFEFSDFESLKNRAVYTYETIEHFKIMLPNADLFLILGYDSYKTLKSWKNYSYIIENSKILIANRSEDAVILPEHYCSKIHISKACPKIDLSSSLIRKRVADNLNIKYLVNEKVRHYIAENNMYTGK